MLKKNLNPLQSSTEDAMKDHKAAVMKGLEKRLHLWNDESFHSQQVSLPAKLLKCVCR